MRVVWCTFCLAGATEQFQYLFMNTPRSEYMNLSTHGHGTLHFRKFYCKGEYTYERGEPLEISVSTEIGSDVHDDEATVHVEVFKKGFWSGERIYSKRIKAAINVDSEQVYTVCIPGYETEEFNCKQQLKMRIGITLDGETISKEILWHVLESP